MLCAVRLHAGPAERSEMEGGEASGAERDGGVCHTEQGGDNRCNIPGGNPHGRCHPLCCLTDHTGAAIKH